MLVALVLALFGLAWGSFINALIWRLHENKDFVSSRSECTSCHHQLKAADLIPVLSWIWLGGKCRYCSKPISVQYPVVEILTSIAFLASYTYWPEEIGTTLEALFFVSWLLQLVILIALFVYDLKWFLLPNKLTYSLVGIVIIEQIVHSSTGQYSLANSLFGLLVGAGLFYAIYLISKGKGIGGGDVKLGIYLGVALGWQKALVALMVAFYSATLYALPLIMAGKVNRKSKIPFGPFIILGIISSKLFGDDLFNFLASVTGIDYYL